MSIFKVAVAVLEERRRSNAARDVMNAEKKERDVQSLSRYDRKIVGHESAVKDGFKLSLKKQPFNYCEITMSHNKGLQLSKMVRYNKTFTNVCAAHDAGVFDDVIMSLKSQINSLLPTSQTFDELLRESQLAREETE